MISYIMLSVLAQVRMCAFKAWLAVRAAGRGAAVDCMLRAGLSMVATIQGKISLADKM